MSDVTLQGEFGQGGAPILESGDSNGWNYIKFSDGTFIAHKAITGLGPISTGIGGGYFSDEEALGSWPFTPVGTPRISCHTGSTSGATAMISGTAAPDGSDAGSVRLARFNSSADTSFFIQVQAIGRWK